MFLRCFHCSFLHKWWNRASLGSTYRIGNEKISYLNLTVFLQIYTCRWHMDMNSFWLFGEKSVLLKVHVHMKLFSQGLYCKWLETQALGSESGLGVEGSLVVHSAIPSLQLSQTGYWYLLYSGGRALRLKGRSVNMYPVTAPFYRKLLLSCVVSPWVSYQCH